MDRTAGVNNSNGNSNSNSNTNMKEGYGHVQMHRTKLYNSISGDRYRNYNGGNQFQITNNNMNFKMNKNMPNNNKIERC